MRKIRQKEPDDSETYQDHMKVDTVDAIYYPLL